MVQSDYMLKSCLRLEVVLNINNQVRIKILIINMVHLRLRIIRVLSIFKPMCAVRLLSYYFQIFNL